MTQLLARYPVLCDARALTFVAAVAVAAAALLLGPDAAEAGKRIIIAGGS